MIRRGALIWCDFTREGIADEHQGRSERKISFLPAAGLTIATSEGVVPLARLRPWKLPAKRIFHEGY
jgi:hypothetical protein